MVIAFSNKLSLCRRRCEREHVFERSRLSAALDDTAEGTTRTTEGERGDDSGRRDFGAGLDDRESRAAGSHAGGGARTHCYRHRALRRIQD